VAPANARAWTVGGCGGWFAAAFPAVTVTVNPDVLTNNTSSQRLHV